MGISTSSIPIFPLQHIHSGNIGMGEVDIPSLVLSFFIPISATILKYRFCTFYGLHEWIEQPYSALVTTLLLLRWQPMIPLVHRHGRPSAAHASSSIDKYSISIWYIRHLHMSCTLRFGTVWKHFLLAGSPS